MTKTKAHEIIFWWKGDTKKFITGERTKREAKEKEAKRAKKDTKEDRMKVAQNIVKAGGKLEVKDESKPFPDETITNEDIPGSSYNNAIPYKGKAKATN